MSNSSISDVEKETGFAKEVDRIHLSEGQKDLVEASEPQFVLHDDDEKTDTNATQDRDGESLSRVPSSKPSVNNVKSVPNGGLKAWMQVLVSFFVFFNTWGIVNAVSSSDKLSYDCSFLHSIIVRHISDILRNGSPQVFIAE